MPVFPSQDLYGKKICETYQQLLQVYGNSIVLDGSGSQKQFLNVTASYVLNAPTGSGTPIYTGSYYPITSSWAIHSNTSITASYATNFGNSITQSFSSSYVWTFHHNLGDKYVILQTVDQYDNQLIPEIVNLYDDNTAIITFTEPAAGTAIATRGGVRILTSSRGDTVSQQFTSSSIWQFTHSLNAFPVLVQAYDFNKNQIIPSNIFLNNNNVATLTFPISESGYAIVSRCGLRIVSGSLMMHTGSTYPITSSWALSASYAPCSCPIMQTGSTYPITSSWALYTVTSSYIQVTGVSYPVKRIYNNYTIVRTTDYTILCDATSGQFDVKLPSPVGNTNIYNIKKIDTTGHRINVMVTNGSLIDYDLTQSIAHRGTNMSIQSDGTNQYWIL
jgi:hypothetical protein